MNLRAIFERTNEDYTWTVSPDFYLHFGWLLWSIRRQKWYVFYRNTLRRDTLEGVGVGVFGTNNLLSNNIFFSFLKEFL